MDTRASSGVSWRAVLTGAVLVGAISLIGPWTILMVKGSYLTHNAIPVIAVVFLFGLTAVVVPLFKLMGQSLAFSRAELITVFAMMLAGSVVVTTGFTGSFLSVITGAIYYATPENNWAALYLPNIHPWLAPTSREAVRLFYEGLPKEMAIPWSAWIVPLLAWIPFILIFYWVIFCTGVLLRGQWLDNERLTFPLTRLPLAMIEDVEDAQSLVGRLFKNRLMWLGFVLPFLLHSWNSLNYYSEIFPKFAVESSVYLLNGQMRVPFRLNLPVIGLGYLMPLNVSFSVWSFYLLGRIQTWILARIGLQIGSSDVWTSGGGATTLMYEQAGGLFVLSLFVLWTARGHLRRFFRQALRRYSKEHDEVVTPRTAVLGLLGGLVLMVFWLTLTGLSFYVAVLLVAGALLVFIGLSRIVSEAGLPGCQTPMVPQAFITRGFGPEVLGLENMTGLGLSTVWIGETVTNMMNAVMHSLKLTSTEERPDRRLLWAMLLAIGVGLAGSIWVTMKLAYTHGGINLHNWYFSGAPKWPFNYMAEVANNPEPSFMPRLTFAAIGGGVMAVLLLLRQRFSWWPFHPIAFPISATYPMNFYWFAIFLAWLFKAVILRYGGVRTYRIMLPFFLGLILGEFFTASLWVFIDGANGIEGNVIFKL